MMAGRSFTRHSNGVGNRIRAEHINELQVALEEDDSRIDLKTDDGQFIAHVDDTGNPHNVTKAQVGLGNVDNTSDMAKPVSTATQAALDTKADIEDAVPAGGVYGQVLTVTHSGKQWADPPGIVYPSLLLSPDGSFDRNGAVSPTINGAVSVVQGQYGQAWTMDVMGASITLPSPSGLSAQGTIAFRTDLSVNDQIIQQIIGPDNWRIRHMGSGSTVNLYDGSVSHMLQSSPLVGPATAVLTWNSSRIWWFVGGKLVTVLDRTGGDFSGTMHIGGRGAGAQSSGQLESFLIFPQRIPDAEIARLSAMPTAWTMQNTAVNMALQSQPPAGSPFLQMYPPNRKIAAGGATLRTAPGASTQSITTLTAGTDVHDTKQTVSVSSVSYSLVVTAFGTNWVPSSTLV